MSIRVYGLVLTDLTVGGTRGSQVKQGLAWNWDTDIGRWLELPSSDSLWECPRTAGGRYIDPVSRAAVAAVRGINMNRLPTSPQRRAIILGTRTGNAYSVVQYEAARIAGKRASPILFAHAGWNVPIALMAGECSARGFTATLCGGDQSGIKALRWARHIVTFGRAEVATAGLADLVSPIEQHHDLTRAACALFLMGVNQMFDAPHLSESDTRRAFAFRGLPESVPLKEELRQMFADAISWEM